LGDLNRALLEAWVAEFGDRLDCVAACPACTERLEAEIAVAELLAESAPETERPALQLDGRRVELRAPTLDDLDAAAAAGSEDAARRELVRRCVPGGAATRFDADATAAVSAALEAVDPQLAVRVRLSCPSCEAQFSALLDIAAHLSAAVDRRAHAVLGEVAGLAAVYGWTEDAVLRLPPARRRAYAELAGR
jgi:hypothetical protein